MGRNKRGFTLIETLLSMVILSGALIVLTSSWSGSLLKVRKARNMNTVALLLQKKATELEIKYQDKPSSEFPENDGGDFGDEYKQYRWAVEIKKIVLPDFSSALASQEGGVDPIQQEVVKKLVEVIQNSVREMKVTVFWKYGEKEADYNITTYLVDYSNLSGGVGP